MKLVAARARLVHLAFARPVVTSRGTTDTRDSVIFEVRDDDGHCGYGEAAPWPGFGTESAADALRALDAVSKLIGEADVAQGELPDEVSHLLRDARAARAALQGALWDLAARRAGRPLAAQLAACLPSGHGAALGEVAVNALLLQRSPEGLLREATDVRAAGYRAAKIKLGGASLEDDARRARAAREGLGPDIRLRGDANGAWTEDDARHAMQLLEPFGFEYIEQPVAPGDIAALARLRGLGSMRIAVDESVATEESALRLLEASAADVFVLKPAMLGGPARALDIAMQARRAGCDVVFSHSFESAVGARHALHCASAWGDANAAHGLCTAGLFIADVAEPVAVRQGVAEITGARGIGIEPWTT